MTDFRRWLYAFAGVTLLTGLSVSAHAQTTMTCTVTANTPLIRAEEYTALTGDIALHCSGGIPTIVGQLVPKVDITVIMTAPITSKLTDVSDVPAFNEALLLIDEPGSPPAAPLPGVPLLNCGNVGGGAPYAPAPAAPFTCDTTSAAGDGGSGSYNGTAGHPNVFEARQVQNSQGFAIQFLGVPVDAPGTGGPVSSRTLRITNIRVNAASLGIFASQNFSAQNITTQIAINGTNFGGNQVITAPVGIVRPGLIVGTGTTDPTATFLQCNATPGIVANTLTLSEGFSTAFKVRNWKQIQDNGTPLATWAGGTAIVATDLNQNVPAALYNTESGFMNPLGSGSNPTPNNPPFSTGSGAAPLSPGFSNGQGIAFAGSASQGTRFAIKFSAPPIGSNPAVPLVVNLTASGVQTGVMVMVCGADANGAGGTPGSCSSTGAAPGTALIPANLVAVYEVAFSNPSALETASIAISVNPTINLALNPPLGGVPEVGPVASAQASFAPFYASTSTGYIDAANGPQSVGAAQPMRSALVASATGGAPIPRFRQDFQPNPSVTLYSYGKCACDLLFPWVVGNSAINTSLVVANTSLDPCAGVPCSSNFTAQPQSGHVTFWFFGTSDFNFNPSTFGTASGAGTVIPPQTSSALVPAGSYMAFVVSPSAAVAGGQTAANGLKPIAGPFAGYVIAQSEFQYCHGIASLSGAGLTPQTYLGLVLDKARLRFNGGGQASALPNTFFNTTQLQRTSQGFADELEN